MARLRQLLTTALRLLLGLFALDTLARIIIDPSFSALSSEVYNHATNAYFALSCSIGAVWFCKSLVSTVRKTLQKEKRPTALGDKYFSAISALSLYIGNRSYFIASNRPPESTELFHTLLIASIAYCSLQILTYIAHHSTARKTLSNHVTAIRRQTHATLTKRPIFITCGHLLAGTIALALFTMYLGMTVIHIDNILNATLSHLRHYIEIAAPCTIIIGLIWWWRDISALWRGRTPTQRPPLFFPRYLQGWALACVLLATAYIARRYDYFANYYDPFMENLRQAGTVDFYPFYSRTFFFIWWSLYYCVRTLYFITQRAGQALGRNFR